MATELAAQNANDALRPFGGLAQGARPDRVNGLTPYMSKRYDIEVDSYYALAQYDEPLPPPIPPKVPRGIPLDSSLPPQPNEMPQYPPQVEPLAPPEAPQDACAIVVNSDNDGIWNWGPEYALRSWYELSCGGSTSPWISRVYLWRLYTRMAACFSHIDEARPSLTRCSDDPSCVGVCATYVACTGAREGAMSRVEVLSGPERRRRWIGSGSIQLP
jgi:hypothetical protein